MRSKPQVSVDFYAVVSKIVPASRNTPRHPFVVETRRDSMSIQMLIRRGESTRKGLTLNLYRGFDPLS